MPTLHTRDNPAPMASETLIELGTVFVETSTGKRFQIYSRLDETVKAGVLSRTEWTSRGYVLKGEDGKYYDDRYKPLHESFLLGSKFFRRDQDQSWSGE